MDSMDKTIQEALQFARSEAGQQLLRLLQQHGGPDLQQAMAQAAAGDTTQAKQLLAALMKNPEALRLLGQFGGNHGYNGR